MRINILLKLIEDFAGFNGYKINVISLEKEKTKVYFSCYAIEIIKGQDKLILSINSIEKMLSSDIIEILRVILEHRSVTQLDTIRQSEKYLFKNQDFISLD